MKFLNQALCSSTFLVFVLALFVIFAADVRTAQSQRIDVSPVLQSGAAHTASFSNGWHISLRNGTFTSESPSFTADDVLDFDVSPDNRHVAILRSRTDGSGGHKIEIINREGLVIARHDGISDLDPADPSLKLYLLAGGNVVLRDNIVTFSVYTHRSGFIDRVSNSSGSPDGEAMSRLISSADGTQVFVYNPRIIRQDGVSSRLSRLNIEEGAIENLFVDDSREITNLTASNDGAFVYVLLQDQQNNVELVKLSDDGSQLATVRAENQGSGAYVQPENNTVTFFHQSNAQVYDVDSGERLANAFFRQQNIVFAYFEPRDNLVLALTGRRNNRDGNIQANAVRAVDLTARSLIHSNDLSHTFTFRPEDEPRMHRLQANVYELLGVTNAVRITVTR
ncbi:hypothetical protein [Cyclonatronum proteinivorum]|nr:hypothetical protein [Cyclonatronum proteinivorum]